MWAACRLLNLKGCYSVTQDVLDVGSVPIEPLEPVQLGLSIHSVRIYMQLTTSPSRVASPWMRHHAEPIAGVK